MKTILVVAGIVSVLPIWRDPGWKGGKNAWTALHHLATQPQKPHIPVDEALARCREAYRKSQEA
jgi:hypothetical protein